MTSSVRTTGYVDPGWEHGVAQDERKKKVRCNYCGKIVSGGIYRLKQHLARVSGEVTHCEKAPDEVFLKMKAKLEGSSRLGRKSRQIEYEEQTYLSFQSNDDDVEEEEEEQVRYKGKGKQLMGDKGGYVINLAPLRSLGYVDPGWDHGVAQDERKKKVKCNYCEKIVSGGVNRFKQHLARIPGEVAPCKNAPEEVYLKIKENMKWHRTGCRQRRPDAKEISAFYVHTDDDDEEEEEEGEEEEDASTSHERLQVGDRRLGKDSRKQFRGMSSNEMISKRQRSDSIMPVSYRQINMSRSSKKSRQEVMSSICKFFYHAGVPSHMANSPYFHKMVELIGYYGPDLAGPSSRMLSGRFLQDEISTIKNYLAEYRASWAVTGCSILADSWKDSRGRTLINFLVSCPRSMYFISSIDATDFCQDAVNLFKLLDKVVEEMGEENVVQVITENTASYQAAGKMLEEKRKKLFWTPCATYCIDRILEEFQNIKLVRECMEKSQKITKLIYNEIGLLNFVKKEITGGQELLMPSISQQTSSFATLCNLLDYRIGLKRMVQSNKWVSSWYSNSDEGKEVEKIVLNSTFWKKMQYVGRSVDPILQLLQKVNGEESLSMPYIYHDMHRAKLAIKANHGDDPLKYEDFWNVIDNHWSCLFLHPLYLAAYLLNPSYRYRPDFVAHPEVVRGLNSCLVRLEPENGKRILASLQISDFGSAKADFGTDLAVSTRSELNPAAWWQQHGINCLELQRIAVRILSQTCSSFGCEHTYDQIHSQKQNRVARKRQNDLIYVHYNLRLGERQIRRKSNNSVSLDSVLQESLLHDWIIDAQKQTSPEDKRTFDNDIEQEDTSYENEFIQYEGGNGEARKGSMEMVSLTDVGPYLDVIPPTNVDTGSDGEDDDDDDEDADVGLGFLDDELSE